MRNPLPVFEECPKAVALSPSVVRIALSRLHAFA